MDHVRRAARTRPVVCLALGLIACSGVASGCGAGGGAPSEAGSAQDGSPQRIVFELRDAADVVFDPVGRPVTWVTDGDSLKVDRDGRTVTVRLIGINAPESVDPRRAVQCFGREAARRAHELLDDRGVFLATDPSQDQYDEYGRLLAYVWIEDGSLVNLALLRQGYANEYTHDFARPYALRRAFRAARDEARRAGRGLWSPDSCAGDYDATPGARG